MGSPARSLAAIVAAGALVGALGSALGSAGCSGGDAGEGRNDAGAPTSTASGDAAGPTTTTSVRASASTSSTPTTPTTGPALPSELRPIVEGATPRAADEPVRLAEQLAQAEAAIRDPAASAELVDAAGRLAQLAYRRLGAHPEWDAQVLAALDPTLHPTVTALVAARRELRAMHTTFGDTLPAWRIVEPLPAGELIGLYQEAEATFGVPWPVLASIHLVETGMGRIQGLSSAGAQGPMQFMPATWAAYGMGGDVDNPRDAIMGAANYLRANGGADGTDARLDNALFRYNNSQRYVRSVRAVADVITADPLTYRGFHAWEVVYVTTAGEVLLLPGYESPTPIPAASYLQANPQAAVG